MSASRLQNRRRIIATLTTALLLGAASQAIAQVAPPPYADPGKLGDADSWKTDEFKADWALGAINAQYAYALGITGAGIKLGDFDTGLYTGSGEFSGPGKYISVHSSGVLEYPMRDYTPWSIPNPPTQVGDKFDLDGDFDIVGSPHGTHTAGIIAANRDGVGVHGVAFAATLVAANALYAGPENGSIETFDPNVFDSGLDGMIATGVRAINNSWGISPLGWVGSNSGYAVGTTADVDGQYNTDTSKRVFDAAANAAHDHQVLLVFSAGNGGPQSVPDAIAAFPYYRPDMTGYLVSVVNIGRPSDGTDVGAAFPDVPNYVMSATSTPCAQTRGWCVAAPGTNIKSTYFSDYTEYLSDYEQGIAKPAEQRTPYDSSVIEALSPFVRYIDKARNVWFAPTYKAKTGTSMAAPMVTGMVGLAAQRFPWMTTPQLTASILTTSHYLPDGEDAATNALNGAAMRMTQVPNFQSGWGLVDIKNLMNGPAQLLRTETFTLPKDTAAVFSNNITDAWLKYQQTTQDPEDEAAWNAEIRTKVWTSGLPANAPDEDKSEHGYQTDRAADRATRALDHGDLIKAGSGTLTLTGANTYSGATEIKKGLLNLDGTNQNSRAVVDAGGTLGGSGTAHGLWVKAGGIVAPGHSIGTLHVDDAGIRLEAGSIYHAELGPGGTADLLATEGAASIGAAKLLVTTEGSQSALSSAEFDQVLNGQKDQTFLLLRADKGVMGAFDTSLMTSSDAFARLRLTYDTTSVVLQDAPVVTPDQGKTGTVSPPAAPATPAPTAPDAAPPTASAAQPAAPVVTPHETATVTPNAAPTSPAPVATDVSPLPSARTATVDVTIASGARYTVAADHGGLPQPLITNGSAEIDGSHLVLPETVVNRLLIAARTKGQFQTYELVTADEGLHGTFETDGLPQFAFFNMGLNYSSDTVTLDVGRNNLGFADVAATPNQKAVARAAEALTDDNVIHDAILYVSNVETARSDFQNLAGELHGDVAGEVLDDSHIVRDAVLERMTKRTADTSAFWIKTIGSFGTTAADGNAGKVHRQTDGLVGGADAVLDGSWIVGVAANYEGTPLRTASMGTSSITSYHFGGYAGGNLLGLSLHLGGAYGHYKATTTRLVIVPELTGIERASYGANQGQAFGELALPLAWDETTIEPFAGISYTEAAMEGFAELGGPASLTAREQSLDRTQSTLGARISVSYRDNETVFTPNVELGWAHTFSGVRPGVQLAFVDGPSGNDFTVYGASADRDAGVIRAGLDAAIGSGFSVGVGYEGQIGTRAQDHGVRLDIRVNY